MLVALQKYGIPEQLIENPDDFMTIQNYDIPYGKLHEKTISYYVTSFIEPRENRHIIDFIAEGSYNTVYADKRDKIAFRIASQSNDWNDVSNSIKENVFHILLYERLRDLEIINEPYLLIFLEQPKAYVPRVALATRYHKSTIFDYITLLRKSRLSEPKIIKLLNTMMKMIITKLHLAYNRIQFIHGDLKSNNMICDFNGDYELENIYLIDFGFSKFTVDEKEYTSANSNDKDFKDSYNSLKDIGLFVSIEYYINKGKDSIITDYFVRFIYKYFSLNLASSITRFKHSELIYEIDFEAERNELKLPNNLHSLTELTEYIGYEELHSDLGSDSEYEYDL